MKRYQNLVIRLFSRQLFLWLYDGPDIYSNEEVFSNRNLVLSSHQATIVMMKEKLDKYFKVFQFLYLGTIRNLMHLSMNTTADWHKIHLHEMCPKGWNIIHCKIKLSNPIGNFINISVDKLSYNGPREFRERCFYGGISVYLITDVGDDVEAMNACWNIFK